MTKKIALCLFGNVGNRQNSGHRSLNSDVTKESELASTNPQIAFGSIKKQIIDKYDADVFIHSWSTSHENELKKLYNPITSVFEKQIDFSMNLQNYGINDGPMDSWAISKESLFSYKALLPAHPEYLKLLKQHSFRTQSRWYSNSKVIKLKRQYEIENNFRYDFVITTRFDCFFKKFITIDDNTKNGFYASKRHGRVDENLAFYDLFFMGDSETMDKFSTIYDYVYDYSIRPPFAARQHVERFVGKEKIIFALRHGKDYGKVQ